MPLVSVGSEPFVVYRKMHPEGMVTFTVNGPENKRVTLLKTAGEVKVKVSEKRGLTVIICNILGRWL